MDWNKNFWIDTLTNQLILHTNWGRLPTVYCCRPTVVYSHCLTYRYTCQIWHDYLTCLVEQSNNTNR